MVFIELFASFFIIGLFGFGGGYGMLSLIQTETVINHHWLSSADFANIVAISQMTPGPIGINSATYCGYTAIHNAGYGTFMSIIGSATATIAIILPSLILMILISKLFLSKMNSRYIQIILKAIKPVIIGLLLVATLLLCNKENFASIEINIWQFCISIFLFFATFIGTMFFKINPIRMICYAGLSGLILLY